jgi:hypothetical protein
MEEAGVRGEAAVAAFLGLPTACIVSPRKRKGFNLLAPDGTRIDVMTARKPPAFLPVPVGKVGADVYVLAHWHAGMRRPALVGWIAASDAAAYRPGRLLAESPVSHLVPASHLQPMEDLRARYVARPADMFAEMDLEPPNDRFTR